MYNFEIRNKTTGKTDIIYGHNYRDALRRAGLLGEANNYEFKKMELRDRIRSDKKEADENAVYVVGLWHGNEWRTFWIGDDLGEARAAQIRWKAKLGDKVRLLKGSKPNNEERGK